MKSSIQSTILRAMQRLGNVRDSAVTYSQVSTGTYDTDSGTVSTTTTSTTCPALFTDYTMNDIRLSEGRIRKEDRRVLIVPSELRLTPQIGDTLTRDADHGSEVWMIPQDGSITKDPSDALWVIQVRKTTDGA